MFYIVTEAPLSADALGGLVRTDSCGAVAGFLAIVCESRPEQRVRQVEYRVPRAAAEAAMAGIATEIAARWGTDRVALARRTGRLLPGDAIMATAVAARHRDAALPACAFAVEAIKRRVPVWKREEWDDGTFTEGWEVALPAPRVPAGADGRR